MRKTCNQCHKDFPATSEYFYRSPQTKDGLYPWCKKCRADYTRKYHQTPKGRAANRAKCLKNRFGITPEEYETMLADQGGVCVICGRLPDKKRLAVDHDHETGEVRGLLCQHCNLCLGYAREDIEVLKNLIVYLNIKDRLGK